MNNDIQTKRQQLHDFVNEQTTAKLIERQAYYDSLAKDDQVDEPFDVWNEDMSVLSIDKDHATLEDIAKLENATQRNFPEALKSFWQQFGTFGGEINMGELTFNTPNVGEFLPCFTENAKPYEKLSDLGLVSYMNWIWNNDKDIFKIQAGQVISNGVDTPISFEQLQSFNNKYTCFGMLCDGYYESHLYLHYSQQDVDKKNNSGNFGMTYWHQDDTPPIEQYLGGFDSPEDLLLECIKGYKAVLTDGSGCENEQEEGEDSYFDLEMLSKWLVKNNSN